MDHKKLLARLDDDTRLRLTARSDRAGLLALASRLLGVGLTGTYIFAGLPLWQLVMVFHGVQLIFFFTLLHETTHDTPFASLFLNRLAGWLSGLIIVLPPNWFRYFHLAHHRHTHDPERDPELAGKPIDGVWRYVWTVSGFPVWWFHLHTLFKNATGRVDDVYIPKRARAEIIREARVMLAFYAVVMGFCVFWALDEVVFLWLLPVVLGQPFLRLYLMAEHGRCPHVANMLENSRTTYTTRLVRWLAWNMPYHAEHHAYPNVPFHKLPSLHEVAKKHLVSTENGYTAFHRKEFNRFSKR